MHESNKIDFRVRFSRLDDHALVTKAELAELLATSAGAIGQMSFRNELPAKAFPRKRRAVWFVRDIRHWLDQIAVDRTQESRPSDAIAPTPAKVGRPRHPVSEI